MHEQLSTCFFFTSFYPVWHAFGISKYLGFLHPNFEFWCLLFLIYYNLFVFFYRLAFLSWFLHVKYSANQFVFNISGGKIFWPVTKKSESVHWSHTEILAKIHEITHVFQKFSRGDYLQTPFFVMTYNLVFFIGFAGHTDPILYQWFTEDNNYHTFVSCLN